MLTKMAAVARQAMDSENGLPFFNGSPLLMVAICKNLRFYSNYTGLLEAYAAKAQISLSPPQTDAL
jgi:hypothetical protein